MTEEKKKKKRQRRRIIEGGSQLSRFDTNKKKKLRNQAKNPAMLWNQQSGSQVKQQVLLITEKRKRIYKINKQ